MDVGEYLVKHGVAYVTVEGAHGVIKQHNVIPVRAIKKNGQSVTLMV
jgi:hypothetical protein